MENEKNVKEFEKPKFEIIRMTETDIITTSSIWEGEDQEGELVK